MPSVLWSGNARQHICEGTAIRKVISILILLLGISLSGIGSAESDHAGLRLADPDVLEALRASDEVGLPAHLTPRERAQMRLPDLSQLPRTPPIADVLYTPAEYERNESIIMRWTPGPLAAVLTEMIVPITTGDSLARVFLVVASTSQQNQAANTLSAAGADLARIDFFITPTNTIWIRDYGPRFVSADNQRIIIDHEYDRPRPQDNQVAAAIAGWLNEDLYDLPLNQGGGNYHSFANGEAFITETIFKHNSGLTAEQVENYFADYQGVDMTTLGTLGVDPSGSYLGDQPTWYDWTGHLDMWFMPIDDSTVMIGQYNPAEWNGIPHQVTEDAASLMQSRGYTVIRTPGWRSGGTHYTYTNGVIVNNLVMMCAFNNHPTENAQAQAAYQQAFPDKTVIPVNCSSIISSSGALHCIVKHQPFTAGIELKIEPEQPQVCRPESGSETLEIDLDVTAFNGFAGDVDLLASGLPPGVGSHFAPATLTPPGESIWTLTLDASASLGTSEISLLAQDEHANDWTLDFPLSVGGLYSPPDPQHPLDQADELGLQPQFSWQAQASASQYNFQLAVEADFNQLVIDEIVTLAEFTPDTELASGTHYYWRVRGHDFCGDSGWSDAQQFKTRFHPEADISPASLSFDLPQHSTQTLALQIANLGDGELGWNLSPASCAGSSPTAWLSVTPASGSLVEGDSVEAQITVAVADMAAGEYSARMCLASNDHARPEITIDVMMTVEQLPPGEFAMDPVGTLTFADTALGSERLESITLSNMAAEGSADILLGQIQLMNGQANYSIIANGCDAALAPQQSCALEVRFAPNALGNQLGVLRINADGQTHNISLSGRGIEPEPSIFEDRFEGWR